MYSNQDILRKHTALALGHKSVDTSLILFPVRLETRFVSQYPVEDICEPDRALYAFQALWDYVCALENPDKDVLLRHAKKVMRKVEDLDTVYREDKMRLRFIATKVIDAVSPTGEEQAVWGRILAHIGRLTTMDVVSDNEATDFLRRLDHVDRTIRNLYEKPFYNGKRRAEDPKRYSQTAILKFARRRLKDCLPVLEMLLPENPADTIVNKFSLITEKQYRKFVGSLGFFKITRSDLESVYGSSSVAQTRLHKSLKEQLLVGLGHDLRAYETYRTRFLGAGGNPRKSRQRSLSDKLRARIGDYHRYTHLAERLIIWRLRTLTGGKKDFAHEALVEKWRTLAADTVFTFDVEREWLRSVLTKFNDYKAGHKKGSQRISLSRLNRHARAIRNRKLSYRVKKKCLLVRIYPDEVAVTQLARPITKDEVGHALDFWIRYQYEKGDKTAQMAAWKALCSLYTPARAAYIARNIFATNSPCISQIGKLASQYKAKKTAYDQLAAKIKAEIIPQLKTQGVDGSEEQAFPVPMTEMMPDRFVLQATLDTGKKGGVTVIRYGHLVPKTLQVGMDLNKEPEISSSDTGLRFDDNLRWMTSYEEAEKMGMAITLPLDAFDIPRRLTRREEVGSLKPRSFAFSSIYVMGVKDFSPDNDKDSQACSALLQDVFAAHLYSEGGLELLKIGTPTNILDESDDASANSAFDTDTTAQEKRFFDNCIVPYVEGRKGDMISQWDAGLLSSLFGLSLSADDNPFRSAQGQDNKEVKWAKAVNKAFLSVLGKTRLHPLINLIKESETLYNYFTNNVLPTGVFPSFRIGDQPYGIVPVCDFKDLRYFAQPLMTLKDILVFLTGKWNGIVGESVLSEENISKQRILSTEDSFLRAASSTPVSKSFYERAAIREEDLLPAKYFRGKKMDKDPITNIFNIVKGCLGGKDESDFIRDFFPGFKDIPIQDGEKEEERYSRYNRFFTWGKLRDEIGRKVWKYGLSGVTDEELDTLITGTFDLFNYRLDAWLTGLLSKRLDRRLKVGSHKIAIGAYGWVFNLKEDRDEPVSNEYVVAPSVNQAITAAVLRSSFNRAANGRSQDYSLSVNLSSSRVRQALRIIDGIRNGLSLGVILGSDLERMLHDDWKKPDGCEMDYFIYFLRAAYPLNRTDTQYAAGDDARRDASLDVLNGVALLEDLRSVDVPNQQKLQLTQLYDWKGGKYRMWNWLHKIFQTDDDDYIIGLVEKGNQDFDRKTTRLIQLIQRMEDAYDALADVVTSESVYKLTECNRVAVEALMNSMNTGRNFPEPDVVEIPVDAAHIEQRVFAALDPAPSFPATDSYLKKYEPSLDQWMGKMLGLDEIKVKLSVDGGTGTYYLGRSVSEGGLGISSSELVYLSGDWDKFRKFLALHRWQRGIPVIKKKVSVSNENELLLQDAEMAVDSMREMIAHARPLKQDDLIVSTVPADETLYCSDNCILRYNWAREAVSDLVSNLNRVATSIDKHFADNPYMPLGINYIKDAVGRLLQCFRIGIPDAVSDIDPAVLVIEPEFRFEEPVEYARIIDLQAGLAKRLRAYAAWLEERLAKADEVVKAGKQGQEWETYPDAIKKLLVPSFIMVPHFKLQGNAAIDSDQLAKQSPTYFQNADRAVVEDNMVGLADVRTQLQALHQVRMYGKMNFLDAAREIQPMQLESDPGGDANWMGAEVKDEASVRDANVYTVLNPAEFLVQNGESLREVAGLMIDYWAERIPYRRQTAAVAFGYDQPDAEPPQAILLGMSAIGGKHHWSEKRMLRTIRSAMYQVKSRAVEPEHVYANAWTSGLFPLLSINPKTEL